MGSDWRPASKLETNFDAESGETTHTYRGVRILHRPEWEPMAYQLHLPGHPEDHHRFMLLEPVKDLIDAWMDEVAPVSARAR